MLADRRIFSAEMEYGASSRPRDVPDVQTDLSRSEVDHVLRNHLPNGIVRIGTMASNGARIYEDHNHPEYALPESTSLRELLALELGSEEIVRDAFEAWEDATGRGRVISINKRVMSGAESWGYHSNFLVDRKAVGHYKYGMDEIPPEKRAAFQMLGLHLATANIFVGSGGIYGGPAGNSQFVIAQKAMYLRHDFHSDTVTYKPVVNLRDEPHSDAGKYARLHITSQDANISPWATLMKWGMSALIIGCMEENIFPNWQFDLEEGTLHRLARHVAMDTTCKQPFGLPSGQRVTAVDIQEQLYAAAVKLSRRVELTEELRWVIAEWRKALDDVRVDPAKLIDRSDWPMRQHMIGRKVLEYAAPDENGRTGLAHEKVRATDLAFDRLTTRGKSGRSIPDILRDRQWSAEMPARELIDAGKVAPGTDTRAWPRAMFVRKLHEHHNGPGNTAASWDKGIATVQGTRVTIGFAEPRQAVVPSLDLLLRAIDEPGSVSTEELKKIGNAGEGGVPPEMEWSL